ncbi:MAG: hypothetical protein NT062_35445 [Proteobacteria bacterium]|nr:hypothetical protein [Pseudomonadota bacterium]
MHGAHVPTPRGILAPLRMGDAYTPGLAVMRTTTVRKLRRLPLPGKVLVEVGAIVRARDVVARTELPGKVTITNLATALGALPDEVAAKLVVAIGGAVTVGAPIARTSSLFGLIKTVVASPIDGVLESVSPITGMAVFREAPIPVEVAAYVDGTIVEVIEAEGVVVEAKGALVQGIFGLGGERLAEIVVVATAREQPLEAADLTVAHRGKIVIAGGRASLAAVRRACELEVAAIVCGGFAYQDIKELLGFDVGVAITGNEAIATTLVLTEGFGDIAMARATFELLTSLAGKLASVNGATQIRAGVIRPEVVVPADDAGDAPLPIAHGLEIGAQVRCIRAPYFGRIGTVVGLPSQPVMLPTETRVRVLEVDLGDGDTRVVVPRANVEVIER